MGREDRIVSGSAPYNKSLASFDVPRTASAAVLTSTHHTRGWMQATPFYRASFVPLLYERQGMFVNGNLRFRAIADVLLPDLPAVGRRAGRTEAVIRKETGRRIVFLPQL